MKYVYICSPYRDNVEYNVAKAQFYCQFATEQGAVPIAPHIYFTQFLDDNDPNDRRLGLDMGLDMLKNCAELWAFGSRISEGMRSEIESAERLGIPVVFYSNRCEKNSKLELNKLMQLHKDKVASPTQQQGITQNEISHLLNIRPGSLSNAE